MEPTIEQALQSAVEALGNQEPEAAIATLSAAAERSPPLEELPEMLLRGILATALAAVGRIEDAQAAVARAMVLALALDDTESHAHYATLARQLDVMDLRDDAVEAAFDRAELARNRGDAEGAEAELRTVLIAAVGHLRADLEASARGMLAETLLMRGELVEAKEHLERAQVLAEALADAEAAQHFAGLLAALARGDGAERFRREADIARRTTEVEAQAGAAMEAGDFDHAIQLLGPLADEAEGADVLECEASLRGMLAQAYLMTGRRAEAEPAARRAIAIAEAAGAKEAAESFRQILQLAVGWTAPSGEA